MIQILHEGRHPGADGAEIVVVQLLALGGLSTEQGAPGDPQILPLGIQILGQQEIFLLSAHAGNHPLGFGVAKQPQNTHSLPGHFLNGAQQGGLLVQGFAVVGEEAGGNIQAAILDEGTGAGVPGGVAPGFKGGSQTAGGEGGGIRFAPHQLLAGKLHDYPPVTGGGDEGVVLFGGNAGHGLEPVGKMRCTLFKRPVLHGICNYLCCFTVEPLAELYGALDLLICLLGEPRLHDAVVKHHRSKHFYNIFHKQIRLSLHRGKSTLIGELYYPLLLFVNAYM